MKWRFGLEVFLILGLLPTAVKAGSFSTIELTVERASVAGEVTLRWLGGHPSYTVYRAANPATLASLSSALALSSSFSYTDAPPDGNTIFYLVNGAACAFGTGVQFFSSVSMQGCAGRAPFAQRSIFCNPECHVCSATAWVENRGGDVPAHHYWTADRLGYSGNGGCDCSVSPFAPHQCPTGNSMLVCAPGCVNQRDPEGNICSWGGCGANTPTPDEYFGGCGGGTAGALCCCP